MSAATDAAASALQTYKPLDSGTAINTANDQYGVGEGNTRLSALKSIVGNLQSSVEAVDPSVTGRTSGTFTTEGQRSALVNKERAPIMGYLNKQQAAESTAQADVTQKQGLASAMASALLSDDKQKYQRLLDQYNSSTARDAADTAKIQHDQQMAEQKRQFDVTTAANAKASAAKSAGSNKAAPKATLDDLFNGYQPGKDNFYTEKVVIPTLISQGMSATAAADSAYAYRLAKFGKH